MNAFMNLMLAAEMSPRLFDLDFQLLHDAVLTLISVLVLYTVLSYLLFNPVRDMLRKRQEKIAGELADAKNAQESAEALRTEYEAKLAGVQKEADEILGDARKRALLSESKIVAEAKEEARCIIDRAHVEAELEKNKLADEVKAEIINVASVLAGKVVAANISADIQERLLDETLKEMGEGTWLS